ncbi:MAG: hypothetical protein AABY22_09805 [Nanoarchaeota archaeon]
MNYKILFLFGTLNLLIGVLNIIFLVESYPVVSLIVSIISILASSFIIGIIVGVVDSVIAVVVVVVVAVVIAGGFGVVVDNATVLVIAVVTSILAVAVIAENLPPYLNKRKLKINEKIVERN